MAEIFWSAIGFAWEKIYEAIVDRDFPNQTNVNNITVNNYNVVVINHPSHSKPIVHTTTGAVRSKNKDKTIGAVTSSHTSYSQQTRGKSIMSLQDVSTLSASPRSIAHTTTDTIETLSNASVSRSYLSPSISFNSPREKGAPSKKIIEELSNMGLSRGYSSPSTSSNSPWEKGAPSKKVIEVLSNASVSRGYSSPSTFSNSPREKGVPSEKIVKKPTKLGSRLPPPPPTRLRRREHLQNDYS
ncbi:uncharacterized protein LOC126714615 [Quercus robur]|uniref:uncharacterized protein LOC126714615 n=1 Tax=Quercus robur TaxID=38942 RepID=UPI002161B09E|nr:uncharacterized protein LOC126714615 [Quercus robur]